MNKANMKKENIGETIKNEIEAEKKSIENLRRNLLKSLKKIEYNWDYLADITSSMDNINNSVVWLLANENLLKKEKGK